MRFSIGYQLPDEQDSIPQIVRDFRDSVSSVYFAWPGHTSGRSVVGAEYDVPLPEIEAVMERELIELREMGIGLTLLFNANCYGERAISESFAADIRAHVDRVHTNIGLDGITTTSPFVAEVVKTYFPRLTVCASVNMRIGTTHAMEYLGELFDAYYMQREYNRDFCRIADLRAYCDAHGKQLYILANSGCLHFCPYQIFHDNLVAHEPEVAAYKTPRTHPSPCWDHLYAINEPEAAAVFLRGSWIRPEDVSRYSGYFDEMKLATRMHSNPRRVLMAYASGRYRGNLLDLTEPAYARRFEKYILDATQMPDDWFDKTTTCRKTCTTCSYCVDTARQALALKSELEEAYIQNYF